MTIVKRISVISVVIVMTICMTVSSFAGYGIMTLPIIMTNLDSATVTGEIWVLSSNAMATTHMEYGFCTLEVSVTCYSQVGGSTYYSNSSSKTAVDYSVTATAFPTAGTVYQGSSVHTASSPDGTISNSFPIPNVPV